ncbi:hypothetical protein RCL_jg14017.t1 [Rhizophagus clarus]|uniref:Uncharacterized protein n=1 Tax=Rhizophagus clarus TaxID=94130 RepID=A0A8H3LN74_9GLOM|nr:hypothetical protein RCL_jg14017.t1 [Rhizophagus clarus]
MKSSQLVLIVLRIVVMYEFCTRSSDPESDKAMVNLLYQSELQTRLHVSSHTIHNAKYTDMYMAMDVQLHLNRQYEKKIVPQEHTNQFGYILERLRNGPFVYQEDLGRLCSTCSNYGYDVFKELANLIIQNIENQELQSIRQNIDIERTSGNARILPWKLTRKSRL